MTAAALLDSNVLIAAVAQAHEHHEPSFQLFADHDPGVFAVAAHSYAEVYPDARGRLRVVPVHAGGGMGGP